MNYATFLTIPDVLPKEDVLKLYTEWAKHEKLTKLKKGIRLFFIDAEFGLTGEDFIHAQKTLRVRFKGYRIPRIIKNRLLKYN